MLGEVLLPLAIALLGTLSLQVTPSLASFTKHEVLTRRLQRNQEILDKLPGDSPARKTLEDLIVVTAAELAATVAVRIRPRLWESLRQKTTWRDSLSLLVALLALVVAATLLGVVNPVLCVGLAVFCCGAGFGLALKLAMDERREDATLQILDGKSALDLAKEETTGPPAGEPASAIDAQRVAV